jgi:tRNA(fMet)-specific endonuclease VapC
MDTSAYAALKRGHGQIRGLLEAADEVVVPTIVLGELYAGFAMGSRELADVRELATFLRIPGMRIEPVTERVAERYGSLMRALRSLGMPVPTNDVWIAAISIETGARILSLDAHFGGIPGVVTVPVDSQ